MFEKSIFLILAFCVFSCSKEIKGPENVPGTDRLEKFDGLISTLAAELEIDDYCYAVATNKDILRLEEHGLAAGKEIEAGQFSDMALSVLALQCSEEGLIGVNDYLSQFGADDDRKMQIRHAMSYSQSTPENGYARGNFNALYKALQTAAKKEVSDLFQSSVAKKLGMKQTSIHKNGNEVGYVSTLNDLIMFSQAIDNHRLFKEEDTHSEMFRPVYFESGERSPAGLGCFIDILDDSKIIWTAGETDKYSTILLKSETDSVSVIMVARSNRLNAPFNLKNGEIKRTPIYYAFVNALLADDPDRIKTDFRDDPPEIRQSIEKDLASGARDEVYHLLCAHLNIARHMQNDQRFNSLGAIYRTLFPKDVPLEKISQQPVARIDATMDYVRYNRNFSLNQDTAVYLFATAEFTKAMTRQPWEYDNVELYFDLNNEKSNAFNGSGDDRQYRFNYDYEELTGNAPSHENIVFAQYDASPTRFNFEIAIPWKTLFNSDSVKPEINRTYGFDIAIADNDGEAREGSLAWNSQLDETPWTNTSFLGNMMLTNSPGKNSDSTCYAIYSPAPVQLDGHNKGEWDNAPRYAIDNEFMSGITGPDDQSGWFRVKWDDDQLYLMVEIRDDVKRLIEKSRDFGWITDAGQDTIWIMTESISLPAGGDKSNRFFQGTLPMKAGNYTLHYQTNQSHSLGRWRKERPELSFYGIALYDK